MEVSLGRADFFSSFFSNDLVVCVVFFFDRRCDCTINDIYLDKYEKDGVGS